MAAEQVRPAGCSMWPGPTPTRCNFKQWIPYLLP